ncbi:MAG: hypothetical protein J6C42_01905, partial [Clostridia bacterium]|nr:hypothetical protein [Clostridia bacterium]
YVDENGDTEIDEGWNATTDETVTIPDTDILVQLYPNEEYEPTVDEPSEEDDIKDKNSSFDANYMLKVFRSNYVITASAGKGGTISPEGRFMMNYFGEKTYTFTPDDGMEITDVLVNGKSIGVVDSYTFKNITSNCTIKVLFEKAD